METLLRDIKSAVLVYVLSVREQNQSQLLPHALLEEELVAVENEVARKTILTGGPDSRRCDSKLGINLEGVGWLQGKLGGICGQYGLDHVVTFQS